MHRDHRAVLIAAMLALVAGAAAAQGMGLGHSLHEGGRKGTSVAACGAIEADHQVGCNAALIQIVSG